MLQWLLEKLGVDTVSDKVRRLCCGNSDERHAAAHELARTRDIRAVPALMTHLTDKDPEVRCRAVQGLGSVGGIQATEALTKALWDISHFVRKSAAGGLDGLQWAPEDDRQRALYAFAGDREAALRELDRIGSAAASAVFPLLNHKARKVRLRAAQFLAEHGDQRVIEPLMQVLGDEDKEIRMAVIQALAKWGDERAVEPLAYALRDEDTDIRVAAAQALAKCGDQRAVEPLQRALKDDFMEVRVAALEALGKCGDERAVQALIQAFKDNPWDAHVQGAATRSLGLIGKTRALNMLQAALNDASASVRRAAAEALGSLEDTRATDLLVAALKDPEVEVREEAAVALIKLGAMDPVLAGMQSQGSMLAINAARKLPEQQRVEVLLKWLTEGHLDDHLPEAYRDIRAAGDEGAIGPLLAVIASKGAAGGAGEALKQILDRNIQKASNEILEKILTLDDGAWKTGEKSGSVGNAPSADSASSGAISLKQLALAEVNRRKS